MTLLSKINQFDVHTLMQVNQDLDMEDFGDYVIIDNVIANYDDLWPALLQFPADASDLVKRLIYEKGEKPAFKTPNGLTQLFPNQYFDNWFQELYKILIEAEFVPHQINTYLKNPEYMSGLCRKGLMLGSLMHDNMIMHKRSTYPSPLSEFEYATELFLGGEDEVNSDDGISFYSFTHGGKEYPDIKSLIDIQESDVQGEIKDILNAFCTVQPDLEPFKVYEGSKYFHETRRIEAKPNRMIIFKGNTWTTSNYSGVGERFALRTCLNVTPGQKEGELAEGPQQPPGSDMQAPPNQPQRWDSEYEEEEL